jgi:hypothetical protein
MKKIVVLLAAVSLTFVSVNAQNLLLNGDFNTDIDATPGPDSWNSWTYNVGGGANWTSYNNDAAGLGSSYVNAGGGDWGDQAGWYQTVSAVAGITYTLSVDSATENWWNPEGKIAILFKDAGGNTLADNQLVVANFQANLPWATYTISAVAPANTAQINVDLKFYGGGTVMFDNASLTVVPEPSMIGLLVLGSTLLVGRGLRSRRNSVRV